MLATGTLLFSEAYLSASESMPQTPEHSIFCTFKTAGSQSVMLCATEEWQRNGFQGSVPNPKPLNAYTTFNP